MAANLENSAVATGLQDVSFHFNPKEGPLQRMFKLLHNCTHFTRQQGAQMFRPGFNTSWTRNYQMYKLDLEKTEEPEIKLPTSAGSKKKQENSRKTFTSASLTMLNLWLLWITTNYGKFFKRWEIPDHLTCLLRNLYADQEATVRTGHTQQTGSKLGKEYVKAVYCHPDYLTYMHCTPCEMPG